MENTRTERLERILGAESVERLSQASVHVVGIGGVGSSCAVALARGGVGSICVVDYDVVDVTNINRQALAFESTLGRPKTEVMREIILDINPDAQVSCISMRVLPEGVPGLFEDTACDYCVDAQDTIVTKLALASYCQEHGIPFVSSMGAANKYDPTILRFADVYETRICPMSRAVRKQARKLGIEHMDVLYTPEAPADVHAKEGAERRERTELGTMSYMPPIMGQMLAARVICNLLGIELQR